MEELSQKAVEEFTGAIGLKAKRDDYLNSLDILAILEYCFWQDPDGCFSLNNVVENSGLSLNRTVLGLSALIKSSVIIPVGKEENMNIDKIGELRFVKNPFKKGNDMAKKAKLAHWYELEPQNKSK